jgi:glycosyltransferase involved in cell wall biosynthesis
MNALWSCRDIDNDQEAASMRIAIVEACSPLAAGDPCGQQSQPRSLARALVRRGHRVTVYTRSESAGYPRTSIIGGVPVENVCAGQAGALSEDEAARHAPRFAAALADRWRVRPPDVVHAFSWTSGFAALGAVRGAGIPVVQTFGSLGSAERRFVTGNAVSESRLRLEAAIARSATLVLANSTDEASELRSLGVPRSAVRVVPAGVDSDSFSPDGSQDRRADPPQLITFAAPGQQRSVATILRALSQLAGADLVIIGGPDGSRLPRTGEYRELARLARELGLRGRVTFAGEVKQARLAALLRSADVLVSASPYEPSGLAAIQAMACGTPAVVSAVGGQRDAVIDGTTGLLIPPLRADVLVHRLRRLLATPALLQAYGIAAVDRATSRYAWDRIATETAAAYQRCLPESAAEAAAAQPAAEEDDAAQFAAAFA